MGDKIFRRKTRRFPMACSVHYFTLNGAGEGTVVDVSLEGAEIRGDLSLQTGSLLLSVLLYLPDGNAPAKTNGASDFVPKTVVPSGVTVLMVHENSNLLDLSAGILREEGYTVVQAADSRLALQLFETYTGIIDLLLVEASLPASRICTQPYEPIEKPHSYPRLHCVELVRWLTSRMSVPRAIVMSTDMAQTLTHWGIRVGMLQFFPLPFSRDVLMSTVRQVLGEPIITPSRFERKPDKSSFGGLKLQCA